MKQRSVWASLSSGTALLPVIAATVFAGPAFAGSSIVRDGQGHAEIVIADRPPRTAALAARELQTYIAKITGARPPIVTKPSEGCPVQIYVGKSAHTERLKVSDEGLEHGAFRMVSSDSWLVLLGRDSDFSPPRPFAKNNGDIPRMRAEWDGLTGEKWNNPTVQTYKRYNRELEIWNCDERGSLNAVYAFLRTLGIRWYMPGELGEIVPKQETIALPQVDRVVRAEFALRQMHFAHFHMAPKEHILWYLRQGLNHGDKVVGFGPMGHGTRDVHGRDEVKKAHPEYYALYGGKRDREYGRRGKPCLSAEGLLQSNVRFTRAAFDIYDAPMVSVMPQDGYASVCQCELCEGKGTPQRGWNGQMSDYVWSYTDRVAREVYKTHPKKRISCFAYGTYLLPPETIEKLSPNVTVGIVQARGSWTDPEKREWLLDVRRQWMGKASGKMLVWDHYLHSREKSVYHALPAYYPHAIAKDLRSLKGISLGEFIEVSFGPRLSLHAPAFNHLNVFVTARLYWDVDRDVDALLGEYYRDFYGPAAEAMKAFVGYSEANWLDMRHKAPAIDKALELLSAARQAAGDSIYGRRIDLLAEYLKPMKELRNRLLRGRKNARQARALNREPSDIRLDGRLDDKFWKGQPKYGLREVQTGRPPFSRTTFQAGWAANALYFGIRCDDRDMKNLNTTATKDGDTNIWVGDNVELLIETQCHSYFQIAISPFGAVTDLDRKGGLNTLWTSGAEVAAHAAEDHWGIEVRLPIADENQAELDPLNGIAGRRPSATYPFYFNLCRQRVRGEQTERSAFSPTAEETFHFPLKFGELIVR